MSAGSGPNFALSTPQNTPANAAPISSRAQQPGLGSVKEGMSSAIEPHDDHALTRSHQEGDASERAAAAAMLAQNPKLVSMIQGKLNSLVGTSSGYVEGLPVNVRRRVVGLKGVQKEHAKLEAKFQEEVLELEKKYFAKFTPLYQKRSDIISGKSEPSDADITAGNQDNEDDEGKPIIKTEADPDEEEDKTPMSGIPEFWLTAMKNEPNLAETITDEDEGALKHLTDIRMEYLDKPGFRLIFDFSENEYFSNKTITKTYFYQDEPAYGGDFVYDHADGDKIQWKSDKDLTVKIETKRQRNKSESRAEPSLSRSALTETATDTKQTRVVKKSVPTDSFFNFFDPPQPAGDEDEEDEPEDNEARIELDYNIGEDIKEKLIPHAIDWFTGEAAQFEHLMDDADDAEFEDEDDEDEDDLSEGDEDEDSEEEVDGPRSAKQDTAECKQS